MIGYFPLGIAFGILMAQAGYSFLWSGATSLFVYAGSLQMLMVSFFTEGTPFAAIAVTALLLNSRHIFYGLSFAEKFRGYGAAKLFLIWGLSDESYSLLCSYREEEGVSERSVHLFSTALIWGYWVIFSMIGGMIGELLPFSTEGIDFALTALFTVILIDRLQADRKEATTRAAAQPTAASLPAEGGDSGEADSSADESGMTGCCRACRRTFLRNRTCRLTTGQDPTDRREADSRRLPPEARSLPDHPTTYQSVPCPPESEEQTGFPRKSRRARFRKFSLTVQTWLPAVAAAISSLLSLLIFGADAFLLPSLILTAAVLLLLRVGEEGRK